MPLYHQLVIASPSKGSPVLTDLFRRYAQVVMGNGGVLRSVENHGIRNLPERSRRKFFTSDGERHFWYARYVSTVFDAPAETLTEVHRFLRNEEVVIRQYTTRMNSNLDLARGRTFRNPYLNTPVAKTA